jgi:translation initiation factor IF-1
MFRIELANKHVVLGRISGKLRKNYIRINPGDRVKVEMNTADLTTAMITFRIRETNRPAAPRPPRRRSGAPRARLGRTRPGNRHLGLAAQVRRPTGP